MILTEDSYQALDAAMDQSLDSGEFAQAMDRMGDFLAVDQSRLPGNLKTKFEEVLDHLTALTFRTQTPA